MMGYCLVLCLFAGVFGEGIRPAMLQTTWLNRSDAESAEAPPTRDIPLQKFSFPMEQFYLQEQVQDQEPPQAAYFQNVNYLLYSNNLLIIN